MKSFQKKDEKRIIITYPEAVSEKIISKKIIENKTQKISMGTNCLLNLLMRFCSNMSLKELITLQSLENFQLEEG